MYYLDMKDKEGAIVLTMMIGDKRGRRRDRLVRRFDIQYDNYKTDKKNLEIRIANSRRNNSLCFAQAGNFIASAKLVFAYNLRAVGRTCNIDRLDNRYIYLEKKRHYILIKYDSKKKKS